MAVLPVQNHSFLLQIITYNKYFLCLCNISRKMEHNSKKQKRFAFTVSITNEYINQCVILTQQSIMSRIYDRIYVCILSQKEINRMDIARYQSSSNGGSWYPVLMNRHISLVCVLRQGEQCHAGHVDSCIYASMLITSSPLVCYMFVSSSETNLKSISWNSFGGIACSSFSMTSEG